MSCFIKSLIFLSLVCLNVNCIEQLLRAFIPKQSVSFFYQLVETQTDIDLWLSTRILTKAHKERFNSSSYEYFAEIRLKDDLMLNHYREILALKGIKIEIIVNDIQKYFYKLTNSSEIKDRFSLRMLKSEREKRDLDDYNGKIVGKYVSFDRIVEWMKELEEKYPYLVSLHNIGKSYEERDLIVLALTDKNSTKISKKLAFIESGIHAREWISIATSVYIIDQFINEYLANDLKTTRILNSYEIHFLIVLNPDGYEYTRKSPNNRFWRKNMKPARSFRNPLGGCVGVDLNRNFDVEWMVSGSSSRPCSEIYAGMGPHSESEIEALTNYVRAKSPLWNTYIALHSYGQFWLAPYSYTNKKIPDNFYESCSRALLVIKKIQRKFKTEFTFGTAADALYESSGTSEDWAQLKASINNSYVIELHPDSNAINDDLILGFDYPENKITQAAEEIYFGFKEYFMSLIINRTFPYYIRKECKTMMHQLYAHKH